MTTGGWGSTESAQAWQRGAELRNRMLAAATERMFAAARIAPGMRVLDVGTGSGDTAIMLAERVGPTGSVIATDVSPTMIAAAESTVRTLGLGNVTLQVMDGAALTLPDAHVDAVVARKSLMFVGDLAACLAGIRRVLRPHGWLAAVVWSTLERNPFHHALFEGVRAHGALPTPPPELVHAFARTTPGAWRPALDAAGFHDVSIEPIPSTRTYPSVTDAITTAKASPIYVEMLSALDDQQRAAAWSDIERRLTKLAGPSGFMSPMESLLLSGRKD